MKKNFVLPPPLLTTDHLFASEFAFKKSKKILILFVTAKSLKW